LEGCGGGVSWLQASCTVGGVLLSRRCSSSTHTDPCPNIEKFASSPFCFHQLLSIVLRSWTPSSIYINYSLLLIPGLRHRNQLYYHYWNHLHRTTVVDCCWDLLKLLRLVLLNTGKGYSTSTALESSTFFPFPTGHSAKQIINTHCAFKWNKWIRSPVLELTSWSFGFVGYITQPFTGWKGYWWHHCYLQPWKNTGLLLILCHSWSWWLRWGVWLFGDWNARTFPLFHCWHRLFNISLNINKDQLFELNEYLTDERTYHRNVSIHSHK